MYFNPHANKKPKKKRGRPKKNPDDYIDYKPKVTLDRSSEWEMEDAAWLINPEMPNVSEAYRRACRLMSIQKIEFRRECHREVIKLYNETIERGLNPMLELRLRVGAPATRVHKLFPIFHETAAIVTIEQLYQELVGKTSPKITDIEGEVSKRFK